MAAGERLAAVLAVQLRPQQEPQPGHVWVVDDSPKVAPGWDGAQIESTRLRNRAELGQDAAQGDHSPIEIVLTLTRELAIKALSFSKGLSGKSLLNKELLLMKSSVWLKMVVVVFVLCSCMHGIAYSQGAGVSELIDKQAHDTATVLWYDAPAERWEHALPVGNGRLGAMVLGKHGEERIQLNEETLWSGGPYSQVVKGGAKMLPRIQQLLFEGKPIEAHKLFGRHLMGDPIEQMKYQCLGNLHLFFENEEKVTEYKRWLDLETGTLKIAA